MSHRSLILGLLAVGRTRVEGLLEGADVLHTAEACRAFGARVERLAPGRWQIDGMGAGSLLEPTGPLDFGNAGTGTRLMMGVAGGHEMTVTFDGDASLRKRPMRRILDPLMLMGAQVVSEAEGGRLPVVLRGTGSASICREGISGSCRMISRRRCSLVSTHRFSGAITGLNRSTVCWIRLRSPKSRNTCLALLRRLLGQKRVPRPPARITP